MKSLFRLSIVFVCLLISSVAFAAPSSFCPITPPVIDGVFDCHEWDSAESVDLQLNVPEGGTTPARLYFMNDDKFLYIGIRILRQKDLTSSIAVIMDANYDRTVSAGDDALVISHGPYSGTSVTDIVYYTGGKCPVGALCSAKDTDFGGTNDVTGEVSGDLTYVTYEIAKPLVTADQYDAIMKPGTVMPMQFDFRLFGADGKFADTYYPALGSQTWINYMVRDCGYWM